MIVHLFSDSIFVYSFLDFLEHNYDINEHRIVLYRKKNFGREDIKNNSVIEYRGRKDIIRLYSILKQSDRIVIHSLGVEFEMLLLFFLCKKICRKSVWLIWGSDLYCKREERKGIIENSVEYMRSRVIHRFPYIACLVTGDYLLATEWYKTNAKMIRVNYAEREEKEIVDTIIESENNKRNYEIRIIIGNSGTKTNRHLDVIPYLRKWKEENIKLILPLSYGDKEYIESVKKEYLREFGDKAIIIEKIMCLEDYMKLLYSADIGIYNNDRQQALGNIFAMMYMGKRVYLNNDTSMWDELVNIQGGNLFFCGDIVKESFLTDEMTNEMVEKNVEIAKKLHYDANAVKGAWDNVFGFC